MTDVTIVDADGVTVTVESEETVVLIDDVGAPGPPGPVHESYPFTLQSEWELVPANQLTEMPLASTGQVISVQATALDAPTGSDAIFDVQLDGVSLWDDPGDRPTFVDGSADVALITTFDNAAFTAGMKLRVVPIQIGSTNPRSGLTLNFNLSLITCIPSSSLALHSKSNSVVPSAAKRTTTTTRRRSR